MTVVVRTCTVVAPTHTDVGRTCADRLRWAEASCFV